MPLAALDFPRSALSIVSAKSVVMVYANSLFFGGHSRYKPYLTWRADLSPAELRDLVRRE